MPTEDVPGAEGLVDIDALAAHFDVHPMTARNWLKRGCPHFKPTSQVLRFRISDVEAWANQVPASDESQP